MGETSDMLSHEKPVQQKRTLSDARLQLLCPTNVKRW